MESATATPNTESGAARGARRRRRRFSALTRQVLAVNLIALGIVIAGVFALDQYRRGLIEGRLDALATHASIVAAALGDAAAPQFLDPGRAWRIVSSLPPTFGPRARVFRNDGELVADSRDSARAGGRVAMRELPPPEAPARALLARLDDALDRLLTGDLPPSVEAEHRRVEYFSEAVAALRGGIGARARHDAEGRLVLNVAAPVRRVREVLGAVLLTAGAPDIEARVRETRRDAMLSGLAVLGLTVLLSLWLAGTVTRPLRRLAAAAERVAAGQAGGAADIPDLSRRADEIGDLSVALRDMTAELRARVEEIERFAADVAHELKNPLSSLHSAADIFVRVEDPADRRRLRDVLLQDIARMNRLIGDISAASRLDAELTRAVAAPVDLAALLETLVAVERGKAADEGPRIVFARPAPGPVTAPGIEDRLGQVFRNLIDNAVSFSPPDGTIRVTLEARPDHALATVEDDGPGLPPGRIAAIFDRFYSERPSGEAFGLHSGLGLNIARRIVEAHGGQLRAENRPGATPGAVAGARFIVRLPR